eukprot:6491420-Amphidinium_carterae.1
MSLIYPSNYPTDTKQLRKIVRRRQLTETSGMQPLSKVNKQKKFTQVVDDDEPGIVDDDPKRAEALNPPLMCWTHLLIRSAIEDVKGTANGVGIFRPQTQLCSDAQGWDA